jgi:hypothetical protein
MTRNVRRVYVFRSLGVLTSGDMQVERLLAKSVEREREAACHAEGLQRRLNECKCKAEVCSHVCCHELSVSLFKFVWYLYLLVSGHKTKTVWWLGVCESSFIQVTLFGMFACRSHLWRLFISLVSLVLFCLFLCFPLV